jgi:hypothetical protein
VVPVAAGAALTASLLSVPVEIVMRQHVQARLYDTPWQRGERSLRARLCIPGERVGIGEGGFFRQTTRMTWGERR